MFFLTHGTTRLPEIPSESMSFQWIQWTTFQPSSNYCLHFLFHLTTRLPVTQVDSTVLPVSFFDQTPSDSRFCPLESGREYWTWVVLKRDFPLRYEMKRCSLQISISRCWFCIRCSFYPVSTFVRLGKAEWYCVTKRSSFWRADLFLCRGAVCLSANFTAER